MRLLLAAVFCAAVAAAPPPAETVARGFGVAVAYDPADFTAYAFSQEPKLAQRDVGTDIPEGVAPGRTVLHLTPAAARGSAGNRIEVTPLTDPSERDFAAAYPGLHSAARALRALLRSRGIPSRKALQTADPALVDSEYSFAARVERVSGPAVSGFAFLAQFTQEADPAPPNNRELTYAFLGITADGRYLVEANLTVNHPSLAAQNLRDGMRQLARLDEGSFRPPLPRLKAMLRSLRVSGPR